jgi:transposase-like protein
MIARMGRKVSRFKITEHERGVLEKLQLDDRKNWRAMVVLGAANGMTDAKQARELRISRNTVRKWRRAFGFGRLQALRDAPSSGRKPKISPETRKAIVAACGPDATCRSVAEQHGVSHATVSRIWNKLGVRP